MDDIVSPLDREVLEWLERGDSIQDIAMVLGMTPSAHQLAAG